MNKSIFLCLFAMAVTNACAQIPDTISDYYRYYMYQWIDTNATCIIHDSVECCALLQLFPTDFEEVAVKYTTDDTIRFEGIAAVLPKLGLPEGYVGYNIWFELRLYKPTEGNTMTLLWKKEIDTTRYDHMFDFYGLWGGNFETPRHVNYFGIYEVYSDSIIYLTDSFYVALYEGIRPESNYIQVDPFLRREYHRHDPFFTDYSSYRIPKFSYRRRKYPYWGNQDSTWHYEEMHGTTYIMPIVRGEGDTCPEVRELRYSVLAQDGAFVQWGGHENHALYELSYGPVGTAPGEGTVVECAVPQHYLAGLERGVDYEVYVRARCDFARSEWTAWSDALLVEADSVASASAAGPEQGQRLFSVAPNPARGAATVTLAAEAAATGCSLTLRDEAGRIAMQRTVAAGTAAMELDLRGLAAGVYVITVSSAAGRETGKLKIEKW